MNKFMESKNKIFYAPAKFQKFEVGHFHSRQGFEKYRLIFTKTQVIILVRKCLTDIVIYRLTQAQGA
jgi:hypothetical protein